MLTSIWTTYGDVALYLYALLAPYMHYELAYILAALWPMLICLCLLLGFGLYFAWQDRRAMRRWRTAARKQLWRELGK